MNELESIYFDDFEKIRQIIEQARQEVKSPMKIPALASSSARARTKMLLNMR